MLSVLLLGARRAAGDRGATRRRRLIAGALLATNYVYVMYNRAAIMEALMAAFIVASWYCSTRAEREPRWGALAGVLATLAFFTKAAAAFYVGALGLAAVVRLIDGWNAGAGRSRPLDVDAALVARGSAAVALDARRARGRRSASSSALFVLPHWSDYQFYNWQMSVTRKPSYDLASVLKRVTWFPILHDTFSRMWARAGARPGRRVGHPGALAPRAGRRAAAVPVGRGRHRSSCWCTTSATSGGSCS